MGNGWGNKYARIKLKSGDDIWLYADEIKIDSCGCLSLTRDDGELCFAISAGEWIFIHPASVIDGGACSVEHWDNKS